MTTYRVRGHHLLCLPSSNVEFPERGQLFHETYINIRDALRTGLDSTIQVVQGPDDLCGVCPISSPEGCRSEQGGEPLVRKWDNMVLGGLGIEPGAEMPVEEYRAILSRNSPVGFCYRCKVGINCEMRALARSKSGE